MNRNDIVVVYCEVMKDGERPLKLLKLARSQQPVAAMPAVAMRFHCQICPPLGQPDCKQCECGEQWRVRRAKTCAKLLRATLSSLQPVVGICGPFMYTHRRTLIDKQLCCLRAACDWGMTIRRPTLVVWLQVAHISSFLLTVCILAHKLCKVPRNYCDW